MNTNENPGCLGVLLRLLGLGTDSAGGTPAAETYPYRLRDDFLSAAERSFFGVAQAVVASRAVICPKVSLSDLFFVPCPPENRSAYNRIAQKHVDFLICDAGMMRPLVGVELDDSSHDRPDRQKRDEFVDRVFQAANLPLVRIPVRRAYSVTDLSAQLEPFLSAVPAFSTPVAARTGVTRDDRGSAPDCPKCGVPMVVRTARQGNRQGESFFGCPNYPRCHQTMVPTVTD